MIIPTQIVTSNKSVSFVNFSNVDRVRLATSNLARSIPRNAFPKSVHQAVWFEPPVLVCVCNIEFELENRGKYNA